MPKTVKTIAIPPFANGHRARQLARAADLRYRPASSSRARSYTIVDDPEQADAVLKGTSPISSTSHHLRPGLGPRHHGARGGHAVTLTERATGKVLFSRSGVEYRERYEISIDPQTYFDESDTALERVEPATWREAS